MPSSVACGSVGLFVYLLVLDGAAIFFFTHGFLLTRTEVPRFSNCSDIDDCHACEKGSFPSRCLTNEFLAMSTMGEPNSSPPRDGVSGLASSADAGEDSVELERKARDVHCWTRPAVKKVVIIIIDALRFDFLVHSRNFDGERKPWMNRLDVLQHLAEQKNGPARLFKFVADPPTTTLQRLKGLTTGGLPTFIDIGQSFGASAIVEDNLLLQLRMTGKRVIMMGDDTWINLFPTAFAEAYPFPSFNVKDLHTVDNGVIQELFPALHRDDWDVLIAHFLGVDHVGHIFGVESPLMVEKLDQYNKVLEDVIELLRNMSDPGGLFEDSLLIVMGDHGQTLHGDHGGGTPEEVETGLFALATHQFPGLLSLEGYFSPCDLEDPISGCIGTFSQLDFSATLATILGVPFPFGSVGQVNAGLFALVAGTLIDLPENSYKTESLLPILKLMEQYRNVLCMNSWQVRKYFEAYSKLAMSGFKSRDLVWLEDLYIMTQNISDEYQESDCHSRATGLVQFREMAISRVIAVVREQVEVHVKYLSAAASLARSKWTQFSVEWMVVGFILLVASILIRALSLYALCSRRSKLVEILLPSKVILFVLLGSGLIPMVIFLHPFLATKHWMLSYVNNNMGMVLLTIMVSASVLVYITSSTRMCLERTFENSNGKLGDNDKSSVRIHQLDIRVLSTPVFVALQVFTVFSNSYIVAEGMVIHFLLASSGILYLRSAFQTKSKVLQAVSFLVLILGMSRMHTLTVFKGSTAEEGQGSCELVSEPWITPLLLNIILTCVIILLPLTILSWLANWKAKRHPLLRPLILGATTNYSFIGLHWLIANLASSQVIRMPHALIELNRLHVPRLIYGLTVILIITACLKAKFWSRRLDGKLFNYGELLFILVIGLLSGASGTIILLMGRKGPWISLLGVLEVLVLLDLQSFGPSHQSTKLNSNESIMLSICGRTLDWSLIAGQIFFCTGHSCSFDGLHFSAAFIGFDEFSFFRQGVLIFTETFGASHILPVIGLALGGFGSDLKDLQFSNDIPFIVEISKGYLWFGLLRGIIMSATAASVCIQRRHLMVWGIFAPKYAFDSVGFLIVDVLVVLAISLYSSIHPKKLHA